MQSKFGIRKNYGNNKNIKLGRTEFTVGQNALLRSTENSRISKRIAGENTC